MGKHVLFHSILNQTALLQDFHPHINAMVEQWLTGHKTPSCKIQPGMLSVLLTPNKVKDKVVPNKVEDSMKLKTSETCSCTQCSKHFTPRSGV